LKYSALKIADNLPT